MGSSTSSPFLTWDKLEEAPVSPSVDEIPQVVSDLKKNFETGETKTYAWRIKQLRAMEKMIMESEALIVEAAARDLHRPPTETVRIFFLKLIILNKKKRLDLNLVLLLMNVEKLKEN